MQQPVGAPEINQPAKNKQNGGQIKLKIDVVFLTQIRKIQLLFEGVGLKVMRTVLEKHIINYFGLTEFVTCICVTDSVDHLCSNLS